MTSGPYPAISLSEARTMALVKRAEIAQGKNPIAERLKAKAALAKDWTVRQLIKDYREKVLVTLAKSTCVCYSRHLKRIENRLGSLGVREVESSDIVALIDDCKLTWGESSLLHVTAKCLFTHACGKRLINANPCVGIMISALLGASTAGPQAPDADPRGTALAAERADAAAECAGDPHPAQHGCTRLRALHAQHDEVAHARAWRAAGHLGDVLEPQAHGRGRHLRSAHLLSGAPAGTIDLASVSDGLPGWRWKCGRGARVVA
jgi:hypothetical protein